MRLEMSLLESLSIEEMINLQGHPVIIKCIQGGRSGTVRELEEELIITEILHFSEV